MFGPKNVLSLPYLRSLVFCNLGYGGSCSAYFALTGVLWGSMQPYDLSRQDSSMNMAGFTDDLPSPSLLEDMDILPDMGIDFDLDPDDMLDCLNGDGDRDSVSVSLDSAVGSSPTHVRKALIISFCDHSNVAVYIFQTSADVYV